MTIDVERLLVDELGTAIGTAIDEVVTELLAKREREFVELSEKLDSYELEVADGVSITLLDLATAVSVLEMYLRDHGEAVDSVRFTQAKTAYKRITGFAEHLCDIVGLNGDGDAGRLR